MKKTLFIIAASTLLWSCNNAAQNEEVTNQELNEAPTELADKSETLNYYGAKITPDNAISSNELMTLLDGKDSVNVKVAGKINACCQKKGCWMDVDLGDGKSMIVKFKDYDFFVPKNASGQEAILEGVATMEVQTVEWLQHKAHDAGQSEEEIAKITEPEVSVSFMANGVIIKGELPAEEFETEENPVITEENS